MTRGHLESKSLLTAEEESGLWLGHWSHRPSCWSRGQNRSHLQPVAISRGPEGHVCLAMFASGASDPPPHLPFCPEGWKVEVEAERQEGNEMQGNGVKRRQAVEGKEGAQRGSPWPQSPPPGRPPSSDGAGRAAARLEITPHSQLGGGQGQDSGCPTELSATMETCCVRTVTATSHTRPPDN